MKLTEARAGQKGIITEMHGDARFISRITSIGLTLGCPIEVLQNEKKQPMLVYGRDTMVAINREECEKIEIEDVKKWPGKKKQ